MYSTYLPLKYRSCCDDIVCCEALVGWGMGVDSDMYNLVSVMDTPLGIFVMR